MEYLELDGVRYSRTGKKWVEPGGMIACEMIQDKLNHLYHEQLDLEQKPARELILIGDQYKATNSLGLALQCYSKAFQTASQYEVGGILPRLTSMYRQMGKPEEAIRILTEAAERFGREVISVPLLVSGAAAYCDIGDYRRAVKCCERAFAENGGKASDELKAVYGRIRKEAPDALE